MHEAVWASLSRRQLVKGAAAAAGETAMFAAGGRFGSRQFAAAAPCVPRRRRASLLPLRADK